MGSQVNFCSSVRMLAVVTLYNPDIESVAGNISTYIDSVDAILIWDNSPLSGNVRESVLSRLKCHESKIIWHGTGENECIAAAINMAWQIMNRDSFDTLLVMDQDSSWTDFERYRKNVEQLLVDKDDVGAIVPYVPHVDVWTIVASVQKTRFFINSGTVLPLHILNVINGADTDFPLDGLDLDLSVRIQKAGTSIYCLTDSFLTHRLGKPKRSGWLPIGTNDYGRVRTFSITRSHVMFLKRHFFWLTAQERWKIFKEAVIYKPITVLLIEDDKWGRLLSYVRGLFIGLFS